MTASFFYEFLRFLLVASLAQAKEQVVSRAKIFGIGVECLAIGVSGLAGKSCAKIEHAERVVGEGKIGFPAHCLLQSFPGFLKLCRSGRHTLADKRFMEVLDANLAATSWPFIKVQLETGAELQFGHQSFDRSAKASGGASSLVHECD